MLDPKHDGKMAKWKADQHPKDGAKRKREHDARKRAAGLKEFRAWVTAEERELLKDTLAKYRAERDDSEL